MIIKNCGWDHSMGEVKEALDTLSYWLKEGVTVGVFNEETNKYELLKPPSRWAGVGQKPGNFDTRIKTYTIDGFYEYELDVSYDEDELGFVVMLEIRWADDGELIYVLDTQRVNSEDAIEYSINSLIDNL